MVTDSAHQSLAQSPPEVGLKMMRDAGIATGLFMLAMLGLVRGPHIVSNFLAPPAAATTQLTTNTTRACMPDETLPFYSVRAYGLMGGVILYDVNGRTSGRLQGWGGNGELFVLDDRGQIAGVYNTANTNWRATTGDHWTDVQETIGQGQPLTPQHPRYRQVRGMLQAAAVDAPCPSPTLLPPPELRGFQN